MERKICRKKLESLTLKIPILANALLAYFAAKLIWNWKEDVPYRCTTALSMSKNL